MTNLILSEIDKALHLQIVFARLGERERFGWWRSMDATDNDGGGAFFKRFLSEAASVFPELAAAEAAILAARQMEKARIHRYNSQIQVQTIFCGSPAWEANLNSRWAHWKKYPSDIPEKTRLILNAATDRDQLTLELHTSIANAERMDFEKTILGNKIIYKKKGPYIPQIMSLAATVELEKGEWSLPYHDRNA